MKIRTCGTTVQLCHWKIEYKIEENTFVTYTPTEEEADYYVEKYQATKTKIDTTDDEWVDGITVPETSTQPMEEAKKLIALGKEGYEQYLKDQEKQKPENLVKQDDSLNKQVTDSQIALAELYEMVLTSQTV